MDKVRTRGITLLELVVAFAMLGLLSLVIFLTLQQSQRAQRVHQEVAARKTQALLVRMHLLELLRGARLLTPNSETPETTNLEFQKPEFDADFMRVDTFGGSVWGDPENLELVGGRLLHTRQGEPRMLGDLGALGTLRVFREAPFVRLEIVFQEAAEDRPERLEMKAHMPLEVVLGAPGVGP